MGGVRNREEKKKAAHVFSCAPSQTACPARPTTFPPLHHCCLQLSGDSMLSCLCAHIRGTLYISLSVLGVI